MPKTSYFHSKDRHYRIRYKALSLAAVQVLLIFQLSGLLVTTASAGTETGEICCTCPEWNNLDEWRAKCMPKEPYEQLEGSKNNPKTPPVEGPTENQAEDASYPSKQIFVRPSKNISGILLDAREPKEYSREHIPGARNVYWRSVQSGDRLDQQLATAAMCMAGVKESDKVIVYGVDDDASYLFWALEYLGHTDVKRMDGGISAWKAAGLPVTSSSPEVQQTVYNSSVRGWLRTDQTRLNTSISGGLVKIVDARDSFADFGRVHLRNAIQISTSRLYENADLKTFQQPSGLRALFSSRGLEDSKVQLVYATPSACTLYYALRLMGYNASVIDGSWWSTSPLAVSNIS